MTSTSTTARPASKSNLSVAKRAELTDAYKKNYAAATAKKPAATTTAASTTARPAATTTAASATAKPASKSILSEARRAELSDAYKKSYAAATAKKPAASLAATVKAKPVSAATATTKPAAKSMVSDARRAELSANYKKNYAAAMAPFKDRIATKNAAKATATVKKATGGYVTKPTFKW